MKYLYHRKRTILLILILTFLFSNISYAYNGEVGIENEVSAYLLGDFERGEILEDYNASMPIEIASITKLMTYLIVMEEIEKGNISFDDLIYIDEEIEKVKGSSFNLKAGEVCSVKELINALIIVSANDASVALAKHTAGSEENFVSMMNQKSEQLNLKNTIYLNCTGLPVKEDVQNTMSTKDIFILSRYIIKKYPQILSISSIPYLEVKEREYKKENTNPLLKEIKGVDGLKTGFTDKAGYCLVSTMNVEGKSSEEASFRFIGIVMGTENEEKRKELSKTLLNYGISNYLNKNILLGSQSVQTVRVFNGKKEYIGVYPEKDISIVTKNGDDIYTDIKINEKIKAPLKKGDKLGKALILKNNEVIEEVALVAKEDLKRANFFTMMNRYLRSFLLFIKNLF